MLNGDPLKYNRKSFCPLSLQICINDVTIGASDDYTVEGPSQEDGELLLIEEIKKSQRRSSWCPEEERKKDDKSEKQRLLLGVCGRRYIFTKISRVSANEP